MNDSFVVLHDKEMVLRPGQKIAPLLRFIKLLAYATLLSVRYRLTLYQAGDFQLKERGLFGFVLLMELNLLIPAFKKGVGRGWCS